MDKWFICPNCKKYVYADTECPVCETDLTDVKPLKVHVWEGEE